LLRIQDFYLAIHLIFGFKISVSSVVNPDPGGSDPFWTDSDLFLDDEGRLRTIR
jgi:hypothetical protein